MVRRNTCYSLILSLTPGHWSNSDMAFTDVPVTVISDRLLAFSANSIIEAFVKSRLDAKLIFSTSVYCPRISPKSDKFSSTIKFFDIFNSLREFKDSSTSSPSGFNIESPRFVIWLKMVFNSMLFWREFWQNLCALFVDQPYLKIFDTRFLR